ncbi:hypothetical protein CEXT_506731 [Caerostris extrusa]|uniref:Uncharacterized protein n=1 Tax=Caerostris extrusa TaxID=172846 RepID=A0AAV4W5N9_CAEEX|nr:hypothetical protein CEXT_506731 [Caerostris extrusa]
MEVELFEGNEIQSMILVLSEECLIFMYLLSGWRLLGNTKKLPNALLPFSKMEVELFEGNGNPVHDSGTLRNVW